MGVGAGLAGGSDVVAIGDNLEHVLYTVHGLQYVDVADHSFY